MSFDTIEDYQIPESPEEIFDLSGQTIRYTYRKDETTLRTNRPAVGTGWNGIFVKRTSLRRIGPSALWEMIVDTGVDTPAPIAVSPTEVTDQEFPFPELDWQEVERSLRQHPAFSGFDETDWQAVDLWINETDSEKRKLFQYWKRDPFGAPIGTIQTLSTTDSPDNSQQDFAALYLLGVESYIDHAPVARLTSLFRTQGMPSVSDLGQVIAGDPFTGVPSGYVWLKRADKPVKQGRGFTWTRVEEWIGAREILVDKDEIFL